MKYIRFMEKGKKGKATEIFKEFNKSPKTTRN